MHKKACFISKIISPLNLLCLFWCFGLLIGILFAATFDLEYFSLMRPIVTSRASIVCLIAAQLLPFLFAAYAAYISKSWLIILTGSCKSFSFSFCSFMIWKTFGSAGWLMCVLILFADMFAFPLLCWFSLRCISQCKCSAKRDLWVCIGLTVLIACIDYFLISPFLVRIIDI